MDFRGQRVVSHPLIYFKSRTFYSVGGRSRNKLKNTFIRWEKRGVMNAATTTKQTSFSDSLFHFPSWQLQLQHSLFSEIFFSDMEKQPHVGGEIVIKLQQK